MHRFCYLYSPLVGRSFGAKGPNLTSCGLAAAWRVRGSRAGCSKQQRFPRISPLLQTPRSSGTLCSSAGIRPCGPVGGADKSLRPHPGPARSCPTTGTSEWEPRTVARAQVFPCGAVHYSTNPRGPAAPPALLSQSPLGSCLTSLTQPFQNDPTTRRVEAGL